MRPTGIQATTLPIPVLLAIAEAGWTIAAGPHQKKRKDQGCRVGK